MVGVIGAFYATSGPKLFSYSNRIGIRRVKIKGRGRDRSRVTLMLRVVEKWKGKREVMVGSSGEKWRIGR